MRCPACTQRNSVAANKCKFCGQKFKTKTSPLLIKAGLGVVAIAVVLGLGSAVGSMFSGAPAPKLKPIAERMAAGPKSPEEAQIMRAELDAAVMKYLEQHGALSSADLLTKLQTEVPSSAFEVLVFDLPSSMKLVEMTCVLQPADYLVVPTKSGPPKVSRISGLQVFDEARYISATPDPLLILLGHTTGDRPKEPQLNAVAILPSGEIADRTDKVFPAIKGTGSANFITGTNNIKVERNIVSSAKDQQLFDNSVNFKDEPFITNLAWKNGKYEPSASLGTNEVGALYAVASCLVDPTATESFRQQLSPEVRSAIKAMADKPVSAPGKFKIAKADNQQSSHRRSRRSAPDASSTYVLTSGDRAFEVAMVKAGRWSVTGLKETKASEAVATQPLTETTSESVSSPEPVNETKVVVQEPKNKVAVVPAVSDEDKKREKREAARREEARREQAKREEEKREEARRVAREEAKREDAKRAKAEREEAERAKEKLAKSKRDSKNDSSSGSGKIVTETSSRVTMRTGPARQHKQIVDVARGETVRILSESNGWLKISVNGREGWVYNSYVKKGGSAQSSERNEKVAAKKEPTPPPAKHESKREKERETAQTKTPPAATTAKTKPAKSKPQITTSKTHAADHQSSVADEPDFVP